jgi:hypothetical protein
MLGGRPTGGGRGRAAKNGEAADARGDSEKKGSTSIWGTDSTPEIRGRAIRGRASGSGTVGNQVRVATVELQIVKSPTDTDPGGDIGNRCG